MIPSCLQSLVVVSETVGGLGGLSLKLKVAMQTTASVIRYDVDRNSMLTVPEICVLVILKVCSVANQYSLCVIRFPPGYVIFNILRRN